MFKIYQLKENKKLKIFFDMAINLLGTGVGLAVLNLLIYPNMAKSIGTGMYGQMQSFMAIVYIVCGTLGTSLCSTRLILNYDYEHKKLKGDFNYILLVSLLACVVIVLLALFKAGEKNLLNFLLVSFIGILNCLSNYFIVGLRLHINYGAIFISKILGCLGYFAGFFFFKFTEKWHFVFICASIFELFYYMLNTNLANEPFIKTIMFRKTIKTYTNLNISAFLNKSLSYIDKILLYPLLGGQAVTIYYVASIFGKIVIMTIEPITNVILSYLAKEKNVSKKVWKKYIVISLSSCIVMFFLCNIISAPVIKYLYPQWYILAVTYVPICTFCLIVSAFINLINPLTLKTFEVSKQIFINGAGTVIYCMIFFLFYETYGILGCCYALIASHSIRLLLITMFCLRSFKDAKY